MNIINFIKDLFKVKYNVVKFTNNKYGIRRRAFPAWPSYLLFDNPYITDVNYFYENPVFMYEDDPEFLDGKCFQNGTNPYIVIDNEKIKIDLRLIAEALNWQEYINSNEYKKKKKLEELEKNEKPVKVKRIIY